MLSIIYNFKNTIYEIVEKINKKWKKLNNLVKIQHKNDLIRFIICCKLIIQATYTNLIQYLNNNVIKLDKNTYEISYTLNGNLYKQIIKLKRGPNPTHIIDIINENNISVYEKISPYLGPNNDFFNYKFSPEFFKNKKLIFIINDGRVLVFNNSDIIKF